MIIPLLEKLIKSKWFFNIFFLAYKSKSIIKYHEKVSNHNNKIIIIVVYKIVDMDIKKFGTYSV